MSDLSAHMAALRNAAPASTTSAQALLSPLEQFRADFKAVWRYWRDSGQISEQELAAGYAEASAAVRAKQGDREWMGCAMAHFRRLAEMIEADHAWSARVRADVRAAKRRAA